MFGWFQDSLNGIAKLIQGQIIASKEKKRFVQVRLLILKITGQPCLMNLENYASWRVFTITHFETVLEKKIPGAPAFISIRLVLSPLKPLKETSSYLSVAGRRRL